MGGGGGEELSVAALNRALGGVAPPSPPKTADRRLPLPLLSCRPPAAVLPAPAVLPPLLPPPPAGASPHDAPPPPLAFPRAPQAAALGPALPPAASAAFPAPKLNGGHWLIDDIHEASPPSAVALQVAATVGERLTRGERLLEGPTVVDRRSGLRPSERSASTGSRGSLGMHCSSYARFSCRPILPTSSGSPGQQTHSSTTSMNRRPIASSICQPGAPADSVAATRREVAVELACSAITTISDGACGG